MLFLLTGAIQVGKTRWLTKLVRDLSARGVLCAGVLAPGIWDQTYKKIGIENVLLPQKERLLFATRKTEILASDERKKRKNPVYDSSLAPGTSTHAVTNYWDISDETLARVNEHFTKLAHASYPKPAFLIVDELGYLELEQNAGISAALSLLEGEPSTQFPCALVVVRQSLLDVAREKLTCVWSDISVITPGEDAEKKVWEVLEKKAVY